MRILIKNIKEIVQIEDSLREKLSGASMADLPTLNNAWLSIKDDIIEDYGSMDDWKGVDDWTDLEVIDASDRLVLPCWCDSHTHLVYAGSRETEFVDRINLPQRSYDRPIQNKARKERMVRKKVLLLRSEGPALYRVP